MPFSEDGLKEYIVQRLHEDIDEGEQYQESVIKKVVKNRYDIFYADEKYYQKKMPKLSKSSNLVDSSVSDVIEWALPSLMRLFFGAENPVTITGVYDSDQHNAQVMQELINYQLMRKNNAFITFYNWFKDSLVMGMGVLKCSWEREELTQTWTETMNYQAFVVFQQNPNVKVVSAETINPLGDVKVTYQTTTYKKNHPKIENVLISEFIFPPRCKNIADAPFVAHKKRVTMSYLKQKEKDGWYANVDLISDKAGNSVVEDELEQEFNDNYALFNSNHSEKARREVLLYECYTKLDVNGDGILEDMIITICEDVILRIEENAFGRHPFFVLSPIRDPHRLFPKRSFSEMVGQIQDIKTGLLRQIMTNIALTNDPKLILSEEAINIEDYIQGRAVIRKKPGYQMSDVAMPMPITPLHPWCFQFLEYMEGQKENRTGITRYNAGLDGSSLNHTATGISALMTASNQRLELISRMFTETGVTELFRFLISLNQKFMDKSTVIRITDKEFTITPEDLQGELDLIISAGVGVSTKEQTMMNLQTLMTALLQVSSSGIPITTPENIYNLMKRWITESGIKNSGDYVTDPAIVQQRMMLNMQMKSQFIASLPLPIQQEYMQTGTLRPEILQQFPPEIQMLLGGVSNGTISQGGTTPNNQSFEFGGAGAGISGGLGTGVSGMDNRKSKGLQASGTKPMA